MRIPIVIGNKSYKFKKDALEYYRNILNSYNFGNCVNEEHLEDLIDLINYNVSLYNKDTLIDSEVEKSPNSLDEEKNLFIQDIRIAKLIYETKCFEIVYTDSTTCLMSYILYLTKQNHDPVKNFNKACRNAIQNDMRLVKLKYFELNSKKGQVKCQETGELKKWNDLVVDHRQPNTFSMIVERFKELKKIDVEKIEYDVDNQLVFKDQKLTEEFVNYHREKANLRIVKKEKNSSRTGMARVKQSTKDLKIE